MKSKVITISTLLLAILIVSFKNKNEIKACFISFTNATNLTAAAPNRLPETAAKKWTAKTDNGEMEITRIDGYRILYNNKQDAPFVNMKVELSAEGAYENDKKNLLENLKYLNTHNGVMETKDLIERDFNGYKIWGLSRGSIESGSTLGIFMMFPGNGVTVYFDFLNQKPEHRSFESVEDYKKQRDRFLEEYTKYLATCKDK